VDGGLGHGAGRDGGRHGQHEAQGGDGHRGGVARQRAHQVRQEDADGHGQVQVDADDAPDGRLGDLAGVQRHDDGRSPGGHACQESARVQETQLHLDTNTFMACFNLQKAFSTTCVS